MGPNSTLPTSLQAEPTIEQKTSLNSIAENQARVKQLVMSVTEKLRMPPRNDRVTSYHPQLKSEQQMHDLYILSRHVHKKPITHLLYEALEQFLTPQRPMLRQLEQLNAETTKEFHRLEKSIGA